MALVVAAFPSVRLPTANGAAPDVRPTEDVYTAPEATPVCRAGICVHYAQDGTNDVPAEDDGAGGTWKGYAGNGIPDMVDLLSASTLPKVAKVFADAGYRAPVPDGTAGGGTDHVDVYLADLADVDGGAYCSPEATQVATAPGWCVLDNDYSPAEYGTRLSRAANLGLDVAHQYFYLVQWAYNGRADATDWLPDASASWVEDEIYPTLDRNRAYLPYGPLGRPASHIGTPGPYRADGAWIFLRFLSERFQAEQGGLPVVVRQIWEDGGDGMDSVKQVLAGLGTSDMDEFTTFSTWNRDPARYYQEGAAYPIAPLQGQVTLSTSRRTAEFADFGSSYASETFRFRPGSSLTGRWRLTLGLVAESVFGPTEMAYVATFKSKSGTPVARVVAKDYDIRNTLSFSFGAGVEYVDIRIVYGEKDVAPEPETYWSQYSISAKVTR